MADKKNYRLSQTLNQKGSRSTSEMTPMEDPRLNRRRKRRASSRTIFPTKLDRPSFSAIVPVDNSDLSPKYTGQ